MNILNFLVYFLLLNIDITRTKQKQRHRGVLTSFRMGGLF